MLIVDDDEENREGLRDVVEMMGCSALLATSAKEALALLEDERPCLIVLDLIMPDMTGAEMLETMQGQPALSATPVVIWTSAPEQAPLGVPLLAKPVDIAALRALMRRTCSCVSLG